MNTVLIIRQLNGQQCEGNLSKLDFCISGKSTFSGHLSNKNKNGWRWDHDRVHFPFILRIIK
jgi:hypothetical protein